MTDKPTDKRVERWTRHPEKAIPYGLFARFSDWWCAGRDARSALPDLLRLADGGQPETGAIELGQPDAPRGTETSPTWATPRTVYLGQLGRGLAEKQWIRYQAEVADARIQLTQIRAKRETAGRRLKMAEAKLAGLTAPTEEELKARVSGEDRTDDAVRAGRRIREFTERRKPLDNEVTGIRTTLAECDAEIARLRESIRVRFDVVGTQAEIIGAYVRRRCAAYLTRLVRKHPDGKRIGVLVRSGWVERPDWTLVDSPPDTGEPPVLAAQAGGDR